jgi:hypothetical protein
VKYDILSVKYDSAEKRLIVEYESTPLGSEEVVAMVLLEIAGTIALDSSPGNVMGIAQLLANDAIRVIIEQAEALGKSKGKAGH